MVILFLLFLIQFSVACACLAVNTKQQETLAEQGWNRVADTTRIQVQEAFLCCDFDSHLVANRSAQLQESCDALRVRLFVRFLSIIIQFFFQPKCCQITKDCQKCPPCSSKLQDTIDYAFKLCGGIGLFFSFTEVKKGFGISRRYELAS